MLGGTNEERNLNNTRSFTIANENVSPIKLSCVNQLNDINFVALQLTIPDKDTTYWCSVYKLPDEVANQEKHIVKVDAAV